MENMNMMDNNKRTYGPKSVCQLVGISHRQLGYWSMIGVIKPTKKIHGSKVFNHYTEEDVETLKRVKKLTEEGFFVSKAAEKVHKEIVDLRSAPGQPVNIQGKPAENGLSGTHSNGLASSLYLEVRLNEEIFEAERSDRPLSCMAIQVFFPPQVKSSFDKNRILLQLSKILTSRKQDSEAISYKKDSIFIWLLPYRTLDETIRFSEQIKKIIEAVEWEDAKRKFNLKTAFGFSSYSTENGESLLVEAEQNLHSNKRPAKTARNGTEGA